MPKKRIYTLCFVYCLLLVSLTNCTAHQKKWSYNNTITLPEHMHPRSVALLGHHLWVSVPIKNRINKLLELTEQGTIVRQWDHLPGAMHIRAYQGKLYLPLYFGNKVATLSHGQLHTIALGLHPDEPAGVAVQGDTLAVADFQNHRIIVKIGDRTSSIGKMGHKVGELYYPTDVVIADHKLYVADSYNDRVQVFNFKGKVLQVIGSKAGIHDASGVAVYHKQVFISDFFGNRVLVYSKEGKLEQILKGQFHHPTDIDVIGGDLYIPNYGSHTIVRYTHK